VPAGQAHWHVGQAARETRLLLEKKNATGNAIRHNAVHDENSLMGV
jgi:hypothetical protein